MKPTGATGTDYDVDIIYPTAFTFVVTPFQVEGTISASNLDFLSEARSVACDVARNRVR